MTHKTCQVYSRGGGWGISGCSHEPAQTLPTGETKSCSTSSPPPLPGCWRRAPPSPPTFGTSSPRRPLPAHSRKNERGVGRSCLRDCPSQHPPDKAHGASSQRAHGNAKSRRLPSHGDLFCFFFSLSRATRPAYSSFSLDQHEPCISRNTATPPTRSHPSSDYPTRDTQKKDVFYGCASRSYNVEPGL